ncbi:hypothetical protein D3C72_2190200 [compost metagenome]
MIVGHRSQKRLLEDRLVALYRVNDTLIESMHLTDKFRREQRAHHRFKIPGVQALKQRPYLNIAIAKIRDLKQARVVEDRRVPSLGEPIAK